MINLFMSILFICSLRSMDSVGLSFSFTPSMCLKFPISGSEFWNYVPEVHFASEKLICTMNIDTCSGRRADGCASLGHYSARKLVHNTCICRLFEEKLSEKVIINRNKV